MKWLVWAALVMVGCSGPSSEPKDDTMVVIVTNNEENNTDNNTMTCPECGDGEVCIDGFCQLEGCEPVCEGTACGPNGCGGMCNPCEGRAQCIDGTCEVPPMDCSGFADGADNWAIPQNLFEDEQFSRTAGDARACGSADGIFTYQTFDLTGDARPDLVLTNRCDSGGVGTIRWEVYENTGDGFAASPSTWAIPQDLFEDEQFSRVAGDARACGGGDGIFTYQTFDITGDGRPDLVLTNRCDTGGVGTLRWDVYENTGDGFASSPTNWALPQNLFEDEQFSRTAGDARACGGGDGIFTYQTFDITGDGRPDLVVTNRCDSGGVGTLRWDVYENTGDGFASSPTNWAIPQNLFEDEQFSRTAGDARACGGGDGIFTYQTFDLTGDARPDLVLTNRCDTGGVGTTRWEVYENTGDGFAPEPTSFALPQNLFEDEQFSRVAGDARACGGGDGVFTYQLMDMDGDGLSDLVLTNRCDTGGVGTLRWEYYRNQGDGFTAESTVWMLPTNTFEDEQFSRMAGDARACGGGDGVFTYQVMDIDADAAPDLVLTNRCDSGGVGTLRWDVHRAACQ